MSKSMQYIMCTYVYIKNVCHSFFVMFAIWLLAHSPVTASTTHAKMLDRVTFTINAFSSISLVPLERRRHSHNVHADMSGFWTFQKLLNILILENYNSFIIHASLLD